ncbi:MAG: hypothetical protein A2V86_09870 [Deltaproteobacteria bacterium RBG_16_49_23]|nr:MAG: hypothetical protein A2V86_09870 [Deltaproteobacteria bacterium RBG_16_49_23]
MYPSPILLNSGDPLNISLDEPIDIALTLSMADLKAHFIDPERGLVRYDAIRNSDKFERYKKLTRGLRSFDLQSLKEQGKRLAFWVNIYNTAVIHGVIELGLKHSVKEVYKFFDRVVYEIGGYRFSLNDMEHGILRSNRRPPYRLFRPFGKKDPRMKFAVSPPDPRIHFALVCGARSCPPIGFYESGQIDFQLQLAAESFINSPQVRILPEKNTLLISMIFKWYKADFGGSDQAIVDRIFNLLDEGEKKIFLREHRNRIRIKYQPYDWNLNQ